MGFHLPLFLVLCVLPRILSHKSTEVTLTISGNITLAQISDSFICATMDWWPPEKCNYNQCPWEQASVLNLNLSHPYLAEAIKAFKPLRIRIGGSLQDQVVYEAGEFAGPCVPFNRTNNGLFGFSEACLPEKRWKELNKFFKRTGVVVTFGLNALYGRRRLDNGTWVGAWDSSNARDFINHTFARGYPVDSWEFGNELSGRGIGANVGAGEYGKDLILLKTILREIYDPRSVPAVAAPGGFFEKEWYADLLKASGPGVVDVVTHHIYNLGAGDDPWVVNRTLDPYNVRESVRVFGDLNRTIEESGTGAHAWVGEAGGSYNSGSKISSGTFLNSFWYLNQLALSAKFDTKVYCRQVLIGGNYGLIDKRTFLPNPDYYSALLWHRLMGQTVLPVKVNGSTHLHAYAHCRKSKPGLTLLLLNFNQTNGASVTVQDETDKIFSEAGDRRGYHFDGLRTKAPETREEYHLTAKNSDHLVQEVLLNGVPLNITHEGKIPPLKPVHVPFFSPIWIAPLSISFVVLPEYKAQVCAR